MASAAALAASALGLGRVGCRQEAMSLQRHLLSRGAPLAVAWTDAQKREIVADYRRDGAALCPDCVVVVDVFPAGAYHDAGHVFLQCPRCKQWVTTSAVEGL